MGKLIRNHDISGVSGVGHVAWVIEFEDQSVVVRWIGETTPHCTSIWDSIEDMLVIHGHEGATVVEWIDDEYSE